jgi:hypothetical protein
MRYFQLGYWKECVDVCDTLIQQYDTFALEINYDLYVRLYSVLYLSLKHIDPSRAIIITHTIRQHYHTNPLFTQQFHNLKSLCGMDDFSV